MVANPKETAVIAVEGMSCDHCRRAIEQEVGRLKGVFRVSVDLGKKEAQVDFDARTVSLDEIKSKIEDLGYQV